MSKDMAAASRRTIDPRDRASRPEPALLWFRQDLRLSDHPALRAALAAGGPVIPVYIWSPEEEGGWPPGAAARWWIHHSLKQLAADLRGRGGRLIIRRGGVVATLGKLCRETGAQRIFFHRRYEPYARAQEERVLAAFPPDCSDKTGEDDLRARGLRPAGPHAARPRAERHESALLFRPEEIATRQGRPFQVFTPFWRACLDRPAPAVPLPAPRLVPGPARWPTSLELDELGLTRSSDGSAGPRDAWRPGEAGANAQLAAFLKTALGGYPRGRDRPDLRASSRLSPHLHHGELSPRQVWHATRRQMARRGEPGLLAGAEAFTRQIGWREFAYHLLVHFPHTMDRPLRAEFAAFPWARSHTGLRAWQQGRTGYPIVDAGMRELRESGWMHNRVRMIAASFLVKDLLIPWIEGARWFWDALVDADLANNTLGWQWAAGCGADAAPYFRIFNPALQGSRFDPEGSYVRRWVPELASLPAAQIHYPDEFSDTPEVRSGRIIRLAYPAPIVDHGAARARALAALAAMRGRGR